MYLGVKGKGCLETGTQVPQSSEREKQLRKGKVLRGGSVVRSTQTGLVPQALRPCTVHSSDVDLILVQGQAA